MAQLAESVNVEQGVGVPVHVDDDHAQFILVEQVADVVNDEQAVGVPPQVLAVAFQTQPGRPVSQSVWLVESRLLHEYTDELAVQLPVPAVHPGSREHDEPICEHVYGLERVVQLAAPAVQPGSSEHDEPIEEQV